MTIKEALSKIFTEYPTEKRVLETLYRENRAFNKALEAGEFSVADTENRRNLEISKYPIASIITRHLAHSIGESAEIPLKQYKIKGSVGNGNIAEIPWISIFDRDITKSATEGYYIVLLFTADSQGAFLSLNQGCTQYFEYMKNSRRHKKEAYDMLRANAMTAQKNLRSLYDFDFEPISLGTVEELGLGYESGNICSKFYSLNYLPSDSEFVNDVRNMLGVYRELKGLIGKDIMSIQNLDNDENYQEKVQGGHKKELPAGPIKKRNSVRGRMGNIVVRDPDIAYTALVAANFQCENDATHKTFLSGRTNENFVEAHHLVPMQFQEIYENSIDVPENIISLCPNCHRAFHNSESRHKIVLITKFLSARQSSLEKRGIVLTADQLIEYYKAASIHTLEISGETVMTIKIPVNKISQNLDRQRPEHS